MEGLTQPIPIQIQNQSPSTVKLGGGDTQNIVIQPGQVQSGGSFPWNGNLTGTGNGPFIVTAKLPPGFNFAPSPAAAPSPSTATQPTQTTATASPSPSPAAARSSIPKILPPSTADIDLTNGFTEETHNCCKKYLDKNGVLFFGDGQGNSFELDRNALTIIVDGRRYEWLFTQKSGKPLPVEWIFCHLNEDQSVSQLTSVITQRKVGDKVEEQSKIEEVSLAGPSRDQSRPPSYGFSFGAQELGTDVKEYGVVFSMDPKACTWGCQLYAQGTIREFRTEPARSPVTIFDELKEDKGVFSGANPYLQKPWWNVMFRLFFEMADWERYLTNKQDLTKLESHELENIGRAYDVWRDRLHEALVEMSKSADPEDKKLIDEMLDLLKINRPSPADLIQLQLKFQHLYFRYGYDAK